MQRRRRQEEAKIWPWRTDSLNARLYRFPEIDGTTGWRIPSVGQIQLLCFVSSNFAWSRRETQLHIDGGYRPAIQNGGKNCTGGRQGPKSAQKKKAPNGAK
jgi:hypothetical protein